MSLFSIYYWCLIYAGKMRKIGDRKAVPASGVRRLRIPERTVVLMGIFGRKKSPDIPVLKPEAGEPVLRCSICTGEQTLCIREAGSGRLKEIMLIRSPGELEEVCRANGIDPAQVPKVY